MYGVWSVYGYRQGAGSLSIVGRLSYLRSVHYRRFLQCVHYNIHFTGLVLSNVMYMCMTPLWIVVAKAGSGRGCDVMLTVMSQSILDTTAPGYSSCLSSTVLVSVV